MNNRDFFLRLCTTEFPRTVGVLEAAPADQLAYRPHPRSRSAQELIGHMVGHEQDLLELAETGTINHRMEVPFGTVGEAVALMTAAHEAARPKLAAIADADWETIGQFRVQGKVLFEAPRRDLAWMLLLDGIHHRGQLSTYLRPMGATVPSIYGPSADTMAAQV